MDIAKTLKPLLISLAFPVFLLMTVTTGIAAGLSESEDNPVIAEVGGEKITLNDLKEAAKGNRGGYDSMPIEEKKKLLDNMITYKLLYLEAKRKELDKTEQVKKAFEEAKMTIMSRYLTEMELLPKVNVTDEEAREYYEKKKESYFPPIATLTGLFVNKQTAQGANNPDGARELAKQIRERLQKGEGFDAIYDSLKDDKEWGGSLTKPTQMTVPRGKYYTTTNFDDIIFNLPKGGIALFELPDRFFIARLDDISKHDPPPFKSVEASIFGNLKEQKWNVLFKEYIEGLKKSIHVKVNSELIK